MGPSRAAIESINRHITESSPGYRHAQMERAHAKLLRTVLMLGRHPKRSPEYLRLRAIAQREPAEYATARDSWVEAVVDQRNTSYRISVERKLSEILADALVDRRDDPLTPISTAIRAAIRWLSES